MLTIEEGIGHCFTTLDLLSAAKSSKLVLLEAAFCELALLSIELADWQPLLLGCM